MTADQTSRNADPVATDDVRDFTSEELALTPFDAAEFLDSEEAISAYLAALLEEGNPKAFAAGLGDVARARGMSQVARDAGLSRESLYRALSGTGNPEFGTILKVMRALGLKLVAQPARTDPEDGLAARN
jgi:probable addiction module antidote protein